MASNIQSISNFGNWNLPLRIQRRGNFFSDDGFQDFRSHFENAARDLLQEFDLHRHEDSFKSYRRLRDRQLSGTDRTAKIAEEADKYKIVMDVEGFSDADLQVRVSGPNEIMVEGRQESGNGGVFSQRSFKRRFSLPGLALVQDSTSVLSSDNVLTVNIPKKIQEITDAPIQSSSLLTQSTEAKGTTSTLQESIQNAKNTVSSVLSDNSKTSSNDNFWDLQIVPRKSFFDDSYFENVRQNFQKSVDEMMENRLRRIDSVGDVGIFRKVRETKEENVQAISVTEDSKEHKIVLDVHGFSEGDLKVRAVSERELVVEGNVEKKTEYTSCTHTFRRNFTLPSSVHIKQATSALSSEGILTIIIPKKIQQSIDYSIPVKSEAASHIQNVLKHEQEKQATFHREHVVPVEQKELTLGRTQTTQESNVTKSTTADIPAYNISDSQSLLHKLERTVKLCEEIDNREPPQVPFSLREEQVLKEKQKEKSHIVNESSDIIRESQRLVDESAKLIQDLSSVGKSTQKEHFVPVQLDAGITVSTSANTQVTESTQHQQNATKNIPTTTTTSSRIIPISFKGSFYDDSVFEDARNSIEKEVRDVFTKYRQSSVVADESRTDTEVARTVQDSSQLVKNNKTVSTILDDDKNYKIVLDVYGFEERELNVRIHGLNEISIEGSSEKSKAGSVSKHSFQRTFQLPECVDLDRTSTALSEEGILTITIPKKNQLILLNKKSMPFSAQKEIEVKVKEIKPTLVVDSSGIVQDRRSEVSTTQKSDQHAHREYIVPLSLDDASDTTSVAVNVQSASDLTSQLSTASHTSTDLSQDILSTSTSCSSIDTQVEKNLNPEDKVINVQGSTSDKSSTKEQTKEIITRPLFNLPIVSRGFFFDDNIFQDSRPMFETILRNKMSRFNRSSSFVDDLSFFKCLRDNKITAGHQMSTFSEDEQFNKIVLDVHGFNEENLKVRALSDNEIVIEGSAEEKTGNSVSRKSFRKNFILPGSMDLRGATSSLSSDGVLNIKIPKRTALA